MRTLITLLAVVTLAGCTTTPKSAGNQLAQYGYADKHGKWQWNSSKVDPRCAESMFDLGMTHGFNTVKDSVDGAITKGVATAGDLIEEHCLKPAPVVIYQGYRTIQQPVQPATQQPTHVIVSPAVVAPIYNTNTRRYE